MKIKKLSVAVATASTTLLPTLYGPSVLAQEPVLEEVVVTGTARARAEFDTPLTVTALDESDLNKYTSNSQADILRQVPGIKAEGGGGEVAVNVFVTGLPSGGQFAFTPLQYDGIPIFSTFGLNSSAFDVYGRNDLGIERLEFVAGGASNLFGAGSVAGIINYISKTGSDDPESTVQLTVAEEGRTRLDFATSGPLAAGSNNYYALSGFYRYDEGPLETGLETDGYQLRGNFKHEFNDGSGFFTIYGQAIDDVAQFFLPLPLDPNQSRARGNDGGTVYTVQTANADRLTYQTPDGLYTTAIRDGVKTTGGMIAFDFEKEMSSEWILRAKTKLADYDHEFNLFLDGDGITNQPLSQEDYLDVRGFGTVGVDDLANASFTWADTGEALPADYLLFGNRILDRDRPATDFTFETSMSKDFDFDNTSHVITIGAYLSRAEADDTNFITTYLAEFNDQPRLVDLTVTDVDGSLTGTAGQSLVVSRNGLVRTNGQTADRTISANRSALYFTDQIEADNWSLDFGVRLEQIEGDITNPGTTSVSVDQSALLGLGPNEVLTNDLSFVSALDGSVLRGEVDDTAIAYSIGGLYRLTDTVNIYANASSGFFFPQLRSVRFDPTGRPGPFTEEEIIQGEIGVKYDSSTISGSVAFFYTELNDRQNIQFVNDGMGGVETIANNTSSETKGIEVIGAWYFADNWRIDANFTYQDAEFTEYDGAPGNIGNELTRNPAVLFNAGITYTSDNLEVSLFNSYNGENFVNDANTIEVDGFNLVGLDIGYRFDMGDGDSLRVGLNVFNLTDSDGITEGSPRQGSSQTADTFFIGRPVLPRRASLRLTYDF
ncbi:MAG: TonB-dependent receptor [Pseudomonadota bacterium]